MSKENMMLLIDHYGSLEMSLNEAANRNLTTFRGKFQEHSRVNKNNREYPYAVLDENVKRLQEVIKARGLVGELDHPQDSIVHFSNVSHVITKLWWEGNILMGEGEILNTASGKILKALIDGDVRVGISSRGVGNGKVNESGVLVIGESFKLITFDAVADPSCHSAFPKVVSPNKRESVNPDNYDFVHKSDNKNEGNSIHTVTKEAVIAAFGSIIRENTQKIKRGLR